MDFISLLFLLLSPLILFIGGLCRSRSEKNKGLHLPPAPPSLPIIGHLHLLGRLPHRSLARLAGIHGPLMLLRLGHVPVLFVSSPEAAMQVMKTEDLAFSGRSKLFACDRLSYGCLNVAFAPYGDSWRFLRKVATAELLSQHKITSFRYILREEMDHFTASIGQLSTGGLVNLTEILFSFLCNMLYRLLFGKRAPDSRRVRLQGHVVEAFELLSGFCPGDLFPSFKWAGFLSGMEKKLDSCARSLDAIVEEELDDVEQNSRPCFAGSLLQMQRDPLLEFPLTRDHIKATVADMFLASTETTSVAIEWAMAELMRHPGKLGRVQSEVRAARSQVEKGDVESLTYLKAVVKETLRLHPPGALPLPRETREACKIGGYDVPAGTRVFVNAWAIGRDERHWEMPGEFLPERFEGSELGYGGQQFCFVPFGGGRRICPGIGLAVTLIELCLAALLLRFDWELPEGVTELDMEEVVTLAVRRRSSLLLKAIPSY